MNKPLLKTDKRALYKVMTTTVHGQGSELVVLVQTYQGGDDEWIASAPGLGMGLPRSTPETVVADLILASGRILLAVHPD